MFSTARCIVIVEMEATRFACRNDAVTRPVLAMRGVGWTWLERLSKIGVGRGPP